MIGITLFLAVIGFMNPEKRNNILNIGILFFCFCGLIGGYVAAIFYRFWGGQSWIRLSIFTSVLFPGTLLFGYMNINIILTMEKSNAAVNFSDIISLFILWIFCTFPLILIGSFFGFKSNHINIPCEINKIPSFIPEKPWYLHYKYITFVTGLIGFATIFIEFHFVMGALWKHEIYFLASFLGISIFMFILVMGEMSVLVVYYNLCYGDYNWWWKSFVIGASPVIYFVLYSLIYCFYLRISTFSALVIYLGMMSLISVMVILVCGATSVFLCMGFLNKIYSAIRVD
jgi:transmembrane 9 superfamily protein 2/4